MLFFRHGTLIGRAIPSNLPNLFSDFNFTSYIFFFVVKLFHVCGLAEINMQTFQIGEPISLKQCELWQKSFVLLLPQFLVEKGELQMKAPRDSKTSNIYKEREMMFYILMRKKEDVLNPWSMIFKHLFLDVYIMYYTHDNQKWWVKVWKKMCQIVFAPLAIHYCAIFPFHYV